LSDETQEFLRGDRELSGLTLTDILTGGAAYDSSGFVFVGLRIYEEDDSSPQ
jgi:hypothetical protein